MTVSLQLYSMLMNCNNMRRFIMTECKKYRIPIKNQPKSNLSQLFELSIDNPIYDMTLNSLEYLNIIGCGFICKIIIKLSYNNSRPFDISCNKMMNIIINRVTIKHGLSLLFNEAQKLYTIGNFITAVSIYREAILFNHGPSFADLSCILMNDCKDIKQNKKEAFLLALKGTLTGCNHSKGMLACFYVYAPLTYTENSFLDCDPKYKYRRVQLEGMKLAQISAAANSKYGQYMMGIIYRGIYTSTTPDLKKRYEYFKLAATQNLAEAQLKLGDMYNEGIYVEKNFIEALYWYKKAGIQEHPVACEMVAYYYKVGNGTDINYDTSIYWYTKARNAGASNISKSIKQLNRLKELNK
jgi:hypothetical protein